MPKTRSQCFWVEAFFQDKAILFMAQREGTEDVNSVLSGGGLNGLGGLTSNLRRRGRWRRVRH